MSFVGGGGVWAEFGRSALAVRTSNLPEPSSRCETWALPDAYVHAVRAWYDRAIRILRELQTFFDTRTVVAGSGRRRTSTAALPQPISSFSMLA